jgi:hypothetical protein
VLKINLFVPKKVLLGVEKAKKRHFAHSEKMQKQTVMQKNYYISP